MVVSQYTGERVSKISANSCLLLKRGEGGCFALHRTAFKSMFFLVKRKEYIRHSLQQINYDFQNAPSPFHGVWQSFITIEVYGDRIPALASSCKKQFTGVFVRLLFFLKVKYIN